MNISKSWEAKATFNCNFCLKKILVEFTSGPLYQNVCFYVSVKYLDRKENHCFCYQNKIFKGKEKQQAAERPFIQAKIKA